MNVNKNKLFLLKNVTLSFYNSYFNRMFVFLLLLLSRSVNNENLESQILGLSSNVHQIVSVDLAFRKSFSSEVSGTRFPEKYFPHELPWMTDSLLSDTVFM